MSHGVNLKLSLAGLFHFSDVKKAKFHLVDLAGSEKAKKTQATGERFKEGKYVFDKGGWEHWG